MARGGESHPPENGNHENAKEAKMRKKGCGTQGAYSPDGWCTLEEKKMGEKKMEKKGEGGKGWSQGASAD
jgi:hypothetical protein